jgi:cytochrome c6
MKRIFSRIFCTFAIALTLLTSLAMAQPAFADAIDGAKIFSNNCASCHAGGSNRVIAAKNLKLAALQKYQKDTVDAIVAQVTKGKGAMPAFSKKLNADEIKAVANYVIDQANKGWKKS